MTEESIRNRLTVYIGNLVSNYKYLHRLCQPAVCGAVVKDNAYGVGIGEVAPALAGAGADVFFVVTPAEGLELRQILIANHYKADIYVLGGVLDHNDCKMSLGADLIPALGNIDQIKIWNEFCHQINQSANAAIYFNSGMNRLGLSLAEVTRVLTNSDGIAANFTSVCVMSHLACADVADHHQNQEQLANLQTLIRDFPTVKFSLANSAAVLRDDNQQFLFDITRPGITIYGADPLLSANDNIKAVVKFEARIIQIYQVERGASIGYGASYITNRDTIVAVVCFGYGDGYLRSAGSSANKPGAMVFVAGHKAPVIGRVSMDFTVIDVTDIVANHNDIKVGDWVEVFGSNNDINQVAMAAGTISYEFLVRLSARIPRYYIR